MGKATAFDAFEGIRGAFSIGNIAAVIAEIKFSQIPVNPLNCVTIVGVVVGYENFKILINCIRYIKS